MEAALNRRDFVSFSLLDRNRLEITPQVAGHIGNEKRTFPLDLDEPFTPTVIQSDSMTSAVYKVIDYLRFRVYGPNVYVFHDDVMNNVAEIVASYNCRRRKMTLLASKSQEELSPQQRILIEVGEAIQKGNYPKFMTHMYNLGLDVSKSINYTAWLDEVIGLP
jgi:hypothetical protein